MTSEPTLGKCEHGHECLICKMRDEDKEPCAHGLPKKALCMQCIAARFEGMPGRILTDEEAAFCTQYGLEHGFDDDNPELVQYSHICWPYLTRGGALCGSPRLWFSGGGWRGTRGDGQTRVPYDDFVACEACFVELAKLQAGDLKPLAMMAAAGRAARRYQHVSSAVRDYLFVIDNPDAVRPGIPDRDEQLLTLRGALATLEREDGKS